MRILTQLETVSIAGGGYKCGPANSEFLSGFIPDAPFGYDFSGACARHDQDYASGIVPREEADNRFLDTMLAVSGDPLSQATAYVYYAFVYVFGGLSYGPGFQGDPDWYTA